MFHFRFIIAKNERGENIGYTHYRFDMDHNSSVIYWLVYFIAATLSNRNYLLNSMNQDILDGPLMLCFSFEFYHYFASASATALLIVP